MGRHTVIADVGNALVRLLRQEMTPDTVSSPDAIGLCSPSDKGDYTVCVHLYDVRESEEIRANAMVAKGIHEQQYPPVYVNLFYMITVYSSGDIKFRSEEEQKILGRIIQILNDHSCLDQETLEPVTIRKPLDATIRMQNMEMEDKLKIYSVPNADYKLSLFYKVAPVEIESMRSHMVQRVIDMDMTVREKKGEER